MWIEIGKWIVILFGVFFIWAAIIMLFKPQTARGIIRKAGSTNLINYTEISVRMIPAFGLILAAEKSVYSGFFNVFGWFMILTSIILYFVPRRLHHAFSNTCADLLKPAYVQLISPFALLIGLFLIYCVY